jgi:hypothetical protein
MTITMTLDQETEARLYARAQEIGVDAEEAAALLLADLLRAEQSDPDTELSDEELAALGAGVQPEARRLRS